MAASDHLITPGGLDPFAFLGYLAAATEKARLWSLVLCNDFRPPAVTYRAAVSLDRLSNGRLDLGIGAGWMAEEYRAAGLPFDPPGVRLARLEETLTLLTSAFVDGTVTRQGAHYTVTELSGHTAHVQQPHPPFVVGGAGRVSLRLAGRRAQIIGINPIRSSLGESLHDLMPESVRAKLGWVAEGLGAEPRGRRDLFVSNYETHLVDSARERDSRLTEIATRYGVPEIVARTSLGVLVGTIDEIAETVRARREVYGFNVVFFGRVDHLESGRLRDLLDVVAHA
jgi:probable F420-dependent oxidoreductase